MLLTKGEVSIAGNGETKRLGGSRMLLYLFGRAPEFTEISADAGALLVDLIPSRDAPIGDSLYDMYDKYPQYRRFCQSPDEAIVFDDDFGLVYSTVQALMSLKSDRWIFSRMYACYIVLVITCAADGSARPRASGNRYIRKAVGFMYDNCSMPITIGDVARYANVNPSYLRKLFLRDTGVTTGEYILRLRVERAKFLLIHTDLTLDEIARLSGFSSGQYLCAVWKKRLGSSPGDFRGEYNVTCGYDTLEGYVTQTVAWSQE